MAITRIPEGLKLNKFEMAVIPSARKLVGTFGYAASPSSQYSGDETSQNPMTKLEQLQYGYRIVEEESNKPND